MNLYTAAEAKEALNLKRARMLKPAGKRHGKGFATALSYYAGVCATARSVMRQVDLMPMGDRAEESKLAIISETKSNWSDVAPRRATTKNKETK